MDLVQVWQIHEQSRYKTANVKVLVVMYLSFLSSYGVFFFWRCWTLQMTIHRWCSHLRNMSWTSSYAAFSLTWTERTLMCSLQQQRIIVIILITLSIYCHETIFCKSEKLCIVLLTKFSTYFCTLLIIVRVTLNPKLNTNTAI